MADPIIYDLDGDQSGLPSTTRSGIPYEIDWQVKEKWHPGENWTQAICTVLFGDSFQWIDDMVGRAYSNAGQLARDLPEENPNVTGQICLSIEQIDQWANANSDGEPPADPVSGWPVLQKARYKATFASVPYELKEDLAADSLGVGGELCRYVIRKQQGYSRELTYTGSQFRTITGNQPIMQAAFKVVCFSDVTYTVIRLPVELIPRDTIDAMLGTINDAIFDKESFSAIAYNFDIGTVLFLGFDDSNKYFDAAGNFVCDLVMNFKWNQNGWNYFLSNAGRFVQVSTDGTITGDKPYTTNDLNALFEF